MSEEYTEEVLDELPPGSVVAVAADYPPLVGRTSAYTDDGMEPLVVVVFDVKITSPIDNQPAMGRVAMHLSVGAAAAMVGDVARTLTRVVPDQVKVHVVEDGEPVPPPFA